MYQVQKRDGKIADFDVTKITAAISKAFDALEKQYHPSTIDLLGLNVPLILSQKLKTASFRLRIFRTVLKKYFLMLVMLMLPRPIFFIVSSVKMCVMLRQRFWTTKRLLIAT